MKPLIVLFCVSFAVITSQKQTQPLNTAATTQRDPQALTTIAESLSAVGGTAINGIRDFTASGTITFYWAGKEVGGSARLLAHGSDEFRMDANLPSGTRSWTVSYGTGSLRDTNGKVFAIPPHIAIALGSLTFPYLRLSAAATDKAYAAEDGGETTLDTASVHKLQMHRALNSSLKRDDPVNHLLDATYFFDSQTHLLSSVQNQTHPVATMTRSLSHDLRFGGVTDTFTITGAICCRRM